MRTIPVVLAALALMAGAAGCGTSGHPARTARATATPANGPSSRSYAGPRSVASAFFVAWGSYDAVHDGPNAFAARCRPLVTARLARELADDQPASADWADKRRRREVSVIRVAALRQPDGAPAPTSRRVYFRVYGDRITRNIDGRTVTPTGVTVVVVHRGSRWLVDRVLFV